MFSHRQLIPLATLLFWSTPAAFAVTPERLASTILLGEHAIRNLGIATEPAELATFERSVFAIGRLELDPQRRAVVSSRISGRLVSLNVQPGDVVTEGGLIGEVESRQPGPSPARVPLRAPRPGTVLAVNAVLGQPVEPDAVLIELADLTTLFAVAGVPEDDAARLLRPPQGRLLVPAAGADWLPLEFHRWAPLSERGSGITEALFTVANPDGVLRPGMRAEFRLLEHRREGVLSISRTALQGDPTARIVFEQDLAIPGAFVRRAVIVGDSNHDRVEILAGLEPGTWVVTRGSYALQFVGPATSGPSLKEALDIAHGHVHATDGSGNVQDCDHAGNDHPDAGAHGWHFGFIEAYAAGMTLLALGLVQALWLVRRRRQAP